MINKLKSDWACGPHPHFQEDGRQETISTRQVLLCVQQGTRAEVYMGTHMLRCLSISFSYRNRCVRRLDSLLVSFLVLKRSSVGILRLKYLPCIVLIS